MKNNDCSFSHPWAEKNLACNCLGLEVNTTNIKAIDAPNTTACIGVIMSRSEAETPY